MSGPFVPTHLVPAGGVDTWPLADPAAPRGPRLEGGLEVQLLERSGDWARVLCSNGWAAWVDGRLLLARSPASPTGPPANRPSGPPAPTSRPPAATMGTTNASNFSALLSDRPKALGLGGAALVVLSSILPWVLGGSGNAFDVPIAFLVSKTSDGGGLSVGLLSLAVAVVVVVALWRGLDRRLLLGCGIAAAALPVLFVVQLQRSLPSAAGAGSIVDFAGIGLAVALAGGVLIAVGPRSTGSRPQR